MYPYSKSTLAFVRRITFGAQLSRTRRWKLPIRQTFIKIRSFVQRACILRNRCKYCSVYGEFQKKYALDVSEIFFSISSFLYLSQSAEQLRKTRKRCHLVMQYKQCSFHVRRMNSKNNSRRKNFLFEMR